MCKHFNSKATVRTQRKKPEWQIATLFQLIFTTFRSNQISMRVVGVDESAIEAEQKNGFRRIPRFCYRKGFAPIEGTTLTKDRGWGCCFRSAQGLLCQFAFRLMAQAPNIYQEAFGLKYPLDLFLDDPQSPFGIQNLVLATAPHGIPPGNWAKPSILAAGIRDIMERHGLGCIVAQDFGIEKPDDFESKFPALLLIPGLFGLHKLDISLFPFLVLCLCVKGALGFVSGHKNSAYYIYGVDCTEQSFLYFDPHTTKEAALTESHYESFFSLPGKSLKAANANPSMLLGFLVEDSLSLDDLLLNLGGCCESPIRVRSEQEEERMAAMVLDIDDLE